MSVKTEPGTIVWRLSIPHARAEENYLQHYFDCQSQYFHMMAHLTDLTNSCVESGMDGLISLIHDENEQVRLRGWYTQRLEEKEQEFVAHHPELHSIQEIPNVELGRIRCRVCTETVGQVHLWFAKFLNVTDQVEVEFVRRMP